MIQQIDGDVAREVVDPVERLVRRLRESLGPREPDDERPHQARAGGDGDAVELTQIDVGLSAGPL